MHEYAVHGQRNALSACPGRIPAKPDRRSAQIVPIPDGMTIAEAAMAEPLAVCLHAARRAGSLMGRRVLVTGCGPIGALMVLVAAHAGAADIVVTDISDFPLTLARRIGASRTINVATEPDGLEDYATDKGTIHVLFEASGHQSALTAHSPPSVQAVSSSSLALAVT